MAKTVKTNKIKPTKEIQIKKDFSYVSPKDGKTYKLQLKEKLFCEKYLEFQGNGVDAIFEAGYKAKNSLVAAAMAYENLRKPHIMVYVESLLEKYGFNDDNVEKQHLFLLNQFADLKTKAKAIEMFYRLRGKYSDKKGDDDKEPSQHVHFHQHRNEKVVQIIKEAESKLKEQFKQEIPHDI